jgi:hypothetical protein
MPVGIRFRIFGHFAGKVSTAVGSLLQHDPAQLAESVMPEDVGPAMEDTALFADRDTRRQTKIRKITRSLALPARLDPMAPVYCGWDDVRSGGLKMPEEPNRSNHTASISSDQRK